MSYLRNAAEFLFTAACFLVAYVIPARVWERLDKH